MQYTQALSPYKAVFCAIGFAELMAADKMSSVAIFCFGRLAIFDYDNEVGSHKITNSFLVTAKIYRLLHTQALLFLLAYIYSLIPNPFRICSSLVSPNKSSSTDQTNALRLTVLVSIRRAADSIQIVP